MAEKTFRWHLATTGDPSGAEDVTDALDDAQQAAEALEETLGSANSGEGMSFDFGEARREMEDAAAAAEELEEAVEEVEDAAGDAAAAFDKLAASERDLATDGKKGLEILREFEQAQVRVIDATKRNTEEIERNKQAFADWQAARKKARQGAGTSELASDPAKFYAEEAEAIRKVEEAEIAATKAKEAEREATLRQKRAKEEAREAARRLKLEEQALSREMTARNVALGRGVTVLNQVVGRMGALGTVIRSLLNPYALIGTAVGLVTGLAVKLWEKMSEGPEKAKKETRDYVTELNKVRDAYNEIEQAIRRERDDQAQAAAGRLRNALKGIDFSAGIQTQKQATERLRAEQQKRLEIQRLQIELAELESTVTGKAGMTAVELAKERLRISRAILAVEEKAAELARQHEIQTARSALDVAQKKADEIGEEHTRAQVSAMEEGGRAAQAEAQYMKAMEENVALQQRFGERIRELNAAIEREQKILVPYFLGLAGKGMRPNTEKLDAMVEERDMALSILGELPGDLGKLEAAASAAKETADKQKSSAEEAARAHEEAANAALQAASQLGEALARANLAREGERETRDNAERGMRREVAEEWMEREVQALEALAEKFASTEALAPVVAKINEAIADRRLTADEVSTLGGEFRKYERQVGSLGMEMLQYVREMTPRFNDLVSEMNQLRSELKSIAR